MDVTRQKKVDTLRLYDCTLDNKRKMERSYALLASKKKPQKRVCVRDSSSSLSVTLG